MSKQDFSYDKLVEINQQANEIGKAIDQFSTDLRQKYHFYPELTVCACSAALGYIININMLIHNLYSDLTPSYIHGSIESAAVVEKLKQQKQMFDKVIAQYE
ncbi:hypothetical protein PT286_05970 [Neisseriaceae bacterium ESL0693]|nr:hypothetical protein [Neisseriaceae bacterium ESL0693]